MYSYYSFSPVKTIYLDIESSILIIYQCYHYIDMISKCHIGQLLASNYNLKVPTFIVWHMSTVAIAFYVSYNHISSAVMFYIHGGSLLFGSGAARDTEALAIAGDVIHVNINYRLDIFGFLATTDQSAPGNVGMLDQVWVHVVILQYVLQYVCILYVCILVCLYTCNMSA